MNKGSAMNARDWQFLAFATLVAGDLIVIELMDLNTFPATVPIVLYWCAKVLIPNKRKGGSYDVVQS